MLREEAAGSPGQRGAKSRPRRSSSSAFDGPFNGHGHTEPSHLLGVLRAWRSEAARQRGVPAYVVLHDATLEGIATLRPQTLSELRAVSGIGDKKLERYGDALLTLVNAAAR